MLRARGLVVAYPDGTRAVDGLSLHVAQGESLGLVGANGAGKTSLMLAVAGVLPVAAGELEVGGIALEKRTRDEVRRRVGLVFQNPDDQLFMPTLYDDIAFGPRNDGLSDDEVSRRVEGALGALGIAHLAKSAAPRLSGGEKRLAAIATVLSMDPKLLLFDEPTAFLDLRARRKLIGLLNALPQAKLIASHDLPFLEEVCGRAVLMAKGRVLAEGRAKDLFGDRRLMEEGEPEGL
ncbi:MAG: energy-coupling factor ABC transporter ATP-binding protein [Christensenellaceae bacterium]|jgi:cobalt/nickel transport system ATP-binding protein|nr:energy-coupling factor ABC transporter ATP-binding protein [Christensenellaceae bacterium]